MKNTRPPKPGHTAKDAPLSLVKGGKAKTGNPALSEVVERSSDRLLSLQNQEGWWLFDLEADVTIPSEYVFLQRFLGRPLDPAKAERIKNYILSKQMPDGGWPLFDVDGAADISATIKAYLALKILGVDKDDPAMIRARMRVLSLGGAERCNVFTRIALAVMGQVPWHVTPAMPVEILHLPNWFFFNLSKVSYWSRTVIVPLLIIYSHKPVCRLKPEESIPELFVTPPEKLGNLDGWHTDMFTRNKLTKNFFILVDRMLKRISPYIPDPIPESALAKAEAWTRAHMQGAGGIGAIFPAMANAVMALKLQGCADNDPDFERGLTAVDDLLLDRFATEAEPPHPPPLASGRDLSAALDLMPQTGGEAAENLDTTLCQPCVSPIWDTCLSLSALTEADVDPGHEALARCRDWLLTKQIFTVGDWALKSPDLESGGWAFQFENDQFPDVDDTASVVMSLVRAGALDNPRLKAALEKAANWVIGMQCSDGGWGAFDIDNNALYLNHIPFADHGALLDPSTADLTARAIEMLGVLGFSRNFRPIARGIEFIKQDQEDFGAWFGRWGVNYIYGTWSVLQGLAAAGEDMNAPYVRKAVDWLKAKQNPDGGWGETCWSYNDKSLAGMGATTPSQTGWALLGLMAANEADSQAAQRGINHLLATQNAEGSWNESHWTGTGFPKVFYLRYHGYSHYFPLWALAVYRRIKSGRLTRQQETALPSPADLQLPILKRLGLPVAS